MKGIVVAAFSGTGKTWIAERYNSVADVDLGSYRFVYDESEDIPFEARKCMKVYQIQPEWPQNYLDAIIGAAEINDLVLVTHCPEIESVMDYYFLPNMSGWKNLSGRLTTRGNNERFIDMCRGKLEGDLGKTHDAKYKKVILGDDEFLESALISTKLLDTNKRRK